MNLPGLTKNLSLPVFSILEPEIRGLLRVVFVSLVVLLGLTQLLFDTKFLSQGGSSYNEEYVATLGWLKDHSSPDDVIITEWIQGAQVVALTGRSVVATSKVYPSEADGVAQRYQDLARFFLSTDEQSALEIAKKYEGRYVFLRKNFYVPSTFDKLPKEETQQAIANGQLTPYGRGHTFLGLLLQKYESKNVRLIYQSNNFLIYEITR